MSAEQGVAGGTDPPRWTVAFVPSTPLLLPEVAGRAAEATAALRTACRDAVAAALAGGARSVVVVGSGAPGTRSRAGDSGSLRGFGVDLEVPFDGPPAPEGRRTPLPHTIGAWLLDQVGCQAPRLGVTPEGLDAALREHGGSGGAVALLVVGDGSARRSEKAPGHLDPGAAVLDAAVASALAGGHAEALARLDPGEGERLLAAGVPGWRAVSRAVGSRPVTARLHHDDAPFGVGYLVADWVVR